MSQVGDFDAGYGLAGFPSETRNPYLRRMSTHMHLQKLAAGIMSMEALVARQSLLRERMRAAGHGDMLLVDTRNRPRHPGLLEGGSLYWIFGGAMQCRQRIVGLHEAEGVDGRSRCLIEIDPEIVSVRGAAQAIPGLALSCGGGCATGSLSRVFGHACRSARRAASCPQRDRRSLTGAARHEKCPPGFPGRASMLQTATSSS